MAASLRGFTRSNLKPGKTMIVPLNDLMFPGLINFVLYNKLVKLVVYSIITALAMVKAGFVYMLTNRQWCRDDV
jgi:hypothetical protein